MKKPLLSIVVPCYNEEKNIKLLLDGFKNAIGKNNFELILVDNGSMDGTKEVLQKELKKPGYSFAKVVAVEKNIGYGNGILRGLEKASGEYLAFTHADLQCKPSDVITAYLKLISFGKKNVLVKGHRINRFSVLSEGLRVISSIILLKNFDDINGQPKVFHKSLLKLFKKPPLDFSLDLYVQYVALKNGFIVEKIPVLFRERKHGQSSWSTTFFSRLKITLRFYKAVLLMRFGVYR